MSKVETAREGKSEGERDEVECQVLEGTEERSGGGCLVLSVDIEVWRM